jgi:hypothetical protein
VGAVGGGVGELCWCAGIVAGVAPGAAPGPGTAAGVLLASVAGVRRRRRRRCWSSPGEVMGRSCPRLAAEQGAPGSLVGTVMAAADRARRTRHRE